MLLCLREGITPLIVSPDQKDIILIVLNTTPFANPPRFLLATNQEKDAIGQLTWFESELAKYHAKQLIIAMHIPPGTSYNGKALWQNKYLKKFKEILAKYNHHYREITILTGHTHMDDIRKMNLSPSQSIYFFATPSISRAHHNYPGFKIFELDHNIQLVNTITYYTTRTKMGKQTLSSFRKNSCCFPLPSSNITTMFNST